MKNDYSFGVETFFCLGEDVVVSFKEHNIRLSNEDFIILNLDRSDYDICIKNNCKEKVSLIRCKIYF